MVRFIQVGIRSYTKLFSHLTTGITILVLLCSGILTNMTYAQVSLKPDPSVIHNSTTTTLRSQQQPHEVKITSPTKGQRVQAGKALEIWKIYVMFITISSSVVVDLFWPKYLLFLLVALDYRSTMVMTNKIFASLSICSMDLQRIIC